MLISDWISDVCSSDLLRHHGVLAGIAALLRGRLLGRGRLGALLVVLIRHGSFRLHCGPLGAKLRADDKRPAAPAQSDPVPRFLEIRRAPFMARVWRYV